MSLQTKPKQRQRSSGRGKKSAERTPGPTKPRRRIWLIASVLFVWTAIIGGLGVIAGILLEHRDIPRTTLDLVRDTVKDVRSGKFGEQQIRWQSVKTGRQLLDIGKVRVFSAGFMSGGSIEEIAGNVLISSPQGHLRYLDKNNRLHPLDLRLRMNMETLRSTELYRRTQFTPQYVRAQDMLAIQRGPSTYDLYITFNRFAGDCFDFVVARATLEADESGIRATSGWRDLWTAHPCIPLKARGSVFEGVASGGRMLPLDEHTLLVTLGDYQFDGMYESRQLSADPATDLGKIVALDTRTGQARHFATGLRNPQGLTWDRQGRLWETEHGPQGGDELNLIREGVDYGWPHTTYGMAYGSPPAEWPFNKSPGRHDNYARPRYAFVPSVGVSNLIAPDPREFPMWDNTLLVTSMIGKTLFAIRLEGEDVVYSEPILMEERLRDIISRKDGTIAILTDSGFLFFIRNALLRTNEPKPEYVTGLSDMPPLSIEETPYDATMSPADRGRALFQSACSTCHSLDGEQRAGPPLNGVVGRPVASVEGYGYSAALKSMGGTWSTGSLQSYISNPSVAAPGTTMPFAGLFDYQAGHVAAFLNTQ